MVVNSVIHSGKHMEFDVLNVKELKALRYIRNALVHDNHSPSVRQLCEEFGYRSPRSAFLLINQLIEKRWLSRRADGSLQLLRDLESNVSHARTVNVPLVGAIPCGTPMLAEENIEAHIPVSEQLARPGAKYFLLRAQGNSMDRAGINEGDLLLVRQQPTAAEGDKVVALINDEATVKEFHRGVNAVVLKPKSSDKNHKPIILTDDFIIQGVVVSVLPSKTY